jgi:hypothetical protein
MDWTGLDWIGLDSDGEPARSEARRARCCITCRSRSLFRFRSVFGFTPLPYARLVCCNAVCLCGVIFESLESVLRSAGVYLVSLDKPILKAGRDRV